MRIFRVCPKRREPPKERERDQIRGQGEASGFAEDSLVFAGLEEIVSGLFAQLCNALGFEEERQRECMGFYARGWAF